MASISAVWVSDDAHAEARAQPWISLRPDPFEQEDAQAGLHASRDDSQAVADPASRSEVLLISEHTLKKISQTTSTMHLGWTGTVIVLSGRVELDSLLGGVELQLGKDAVVRLTGCDEGRYGAGKSTEKTTRPLLREGVWANVITAGEVNLGDVVQVDRTAGYCVAVLTVSDSAFRGDYADRSGPALLALLSKHGLGATRYAVVDDELSRIASKLETWCDDGFVDVVLTTGGTGLSVRDVTPEATRKVCFRDVPGIPELIRQKSAEIVKTAWLSRAVAGIRAKTLVINLPGSRKAAEECISFVFPILNHALEILRGDISHCGRIPDKTV
jgi:molybdenum cofactor synthesis domain-containing protein